MVDIAAFLKDCVFYPCSALHGAPIKFLSKKFPRFFYADYSIKRDEFDATIKGQGFKGYRLNIIDEIAPDALFGMSWSDFARKHQRTISKVHGGRPDPFIVWSRFERSPGFDDNHGPEHFELLFACAEAIATFKSAFSRRRIAPQCLVHVRSGIGFGGNYSDYPLDLKSALLENNGDLPAFMFYDQMGSTRGWGDYLELVELYVPIERHGGGLTLAKLDGNPLGHFRERERRERTHLD